jgi:hypothetical protein
MMNFNPPASHRALKRTAESFSPTNPQPTTNITEPRILHRHHHRRRNIAATVWGPTIPHPAHLKPSLFNIYKSLLRHPNLFFQFTLRLPLRTAIALYTIDKEFHYLFNKYSVSLLHDYARYHAPLASHVFSWTLYPELCISDPMLRPMDRRQWLARDVPGWRWVEMVVWRQGVVRRVLTRLGLEGLRVGRGVEEAVYKFWGLMEMKTTRMREAFLRDREIWTDMDVLNFQAFLIKLDMRFSDPVLGNGSCGLSHLLLTQKSLSTLAYVLSGKIKLDYDTTTDMVIRTYLMEELDTDALPWLDDEVDNGVPEEWWGIMMREGWHMDGSRMESAVDMVIMEGIRRELHVQQYFLDFVLHGYVDNDGRNMPVVRKWRGDQKVVESKGWPGKEARQKVIVDLDERFGIVKSRCGIGEATDIGA